MVVQNTFPADIRVKNEADALSQAGHQVSVICLRSRSEPLHEVVGGIHVYRIQRLELFKKTLQRGNSGIHRITRITTSVLGYIFEYSYFTSTSLLLSLLVMFRDGFDVLHAHNPPDTLFLLALFYRPLGVRYVFDHHDLSPELYLSRYGAKKDALYRTLLALEWVNLKLAHMTIATNESYRRIHLERGAREPEKVVVVRNGPNQERMKAYTANPVLRGKQKKILCYVGLLNPQDGGDYLLRSLQILRYTMGRSDFHCVIMGSGDSLQDLRQLNQQLQLESHVDILGYIPKADLFANLAAADICVDPDPSSPLNDLSTWIKIMEYMAFSKPIVAFDLKETRFSAQGASLYARPNDETDFARLIELLMDNEAMRKSMGVEGRRRVEEHLQWSIQGQALVQSYSRLLSSN